MTSVGLIDVGSCDLREMLMKTISSKDLKMVCQGTNLKVARAKTMFASGRDGRSREGSRDAKQATLREGCIH